MEVVKVCEYKKQKKGEISCTVVVRIKMDVTIQIILKMEFKEGLCTKNWILGIYHILYSINHFKAIYKQ